MKTLRAPMKWSENREHIRILIDLRDIKNESVNFESQKLTFTCESWKKSYKEEMNLLKEIDIKKSSHNKTAFRLEILLIKVEKDKWNKITANDKRYPSLKVDWDHFEDSELSEEEEEQPNPMRGMPGMPGMGGMGGMPGMPGMGGMGGMPGMGGMGGMPGMPGMGGMGGMPGMGGMGGMPGMPGGGMGGMDMAKMMEAMKNMKGGQGLGGMKGMPVGEDSDDESDDEPVETLNDLEGDNTEEPVKESKPVETTPEVAEPTKTTTEAVDTKPEVENKEGN